MIVRYRTQGFVFKKEDRLEADRIFSVFTKDFGRIEIFGKAIRKIVSKLKGNIEIFSLSEIEFIQGKNRKTLTDAISINKFSNLTNNPEKLLLAIKVSEVINNFIKGEERDQKVWGLIIDTFEKLNNYSSAKFFKENLGGQEPPTTNYQLIYYYFIWNFVFILGYGPELSKCVVCFQKLNPYNLYFSNKEGGVICKNCYIAKKDSIKIKPDVVKVLRLILKKDWGILSKLKIEDSIQKLLKEISDNYYLYLLSSYSFKP